MQKTKNQIFTYFFSFLSALIVYGFPLTNFTLTPDSEFPIDKYYSLSLGRWGTNLVRYHLFDGLYPYYTLLVGLLFLSLTAVEMTKLLKINGIFRYVFILLFLSFPQHAYQLAFTMQADAIGIGYFTSVLAVVLYTRLPSKFNFIYLIKITAVVLLLLLSIAIYQALIIVSIVLFALYFFNQWYTDEVDAKKLWRNVLMFIGVLVVTSLLYIISVKIFCTVEKSGGYLATYLNEGNGHFFSDYFKLLIGNNLGSFYYGEKAYILVTIGILIGVWVFIREKQYLWIKLLTFLFLFVFPFSISLFTKADANPPRLYLGSTVVFAFVITFVLKKIHLKYTNQILFLSLVIFLWNTFYINNLFYNSNRIYKQDLKTAEKINNNIIKHITDFNPNNDYVYFYGMPSKKPYEEMLLKDSEIFSGSILRWENGSNRRIVNFFEFNDLANYKLLDNEEEFNKIKDSIAAMPVFPAEGSIKKISHTVVVKLGFSKGMPLPFEKSTEQDAIFNVKKELKIEPLQDDISQDDSIMGGVDEFVQTGNRILIAGWVAYEKIPSEGTKISLILKNQDHQFDVETNKKLRVDVTDYLGDGTNYNSSGYIADFDVSGLPKGTYEVGLRLKDTISGKDSYKNSYKTIDIK